jgi:hypothetical protein
MSKLINNNNNQNVLVDRFLTMRIIFSAHSRSVGFCLAPNIGRRAVIFGVCSTSQSRSIYQVRLLLPSNPSRSSQLPISPRPLLTLPSPLRSPISRSRSKIPLPASFAADVPISYFLSPFLPQSLVATA